MFEYRDYNDVPVIEKSATAMIRTAYSSPLADTTNQATYIVRNNTMKGLLSAALNAVIAETLGTGLEQVQPDSQLVADLGMSAQMKKQLRQELAFIFNSNEVDIADSMKVKDVLEQIAKIEFSRLNLRVSG